MKTVVLANENERIEHMIRSYLAEHNGDFSRIKIYVIYIVYIHILYKISQFF